MSQVGRAFVQGRMALPPPESLGEQQSEIGPLEADPKLQWILEIAGPAATSDLSCQSRWLSRSSSGHATTASPPEWWLLLPCRPDLTWETVTGRLSWTLQSDHRRSRQRGQADVSWASTDKEMLNFWRDLHGEEPNSPSGEIQDKDAEL